MNFIGVGPAELILILVVALVFVGPERLPRLAADLARTIREIRKYTGSLAAEFNEVIQDLDKETAGERSDWKDITEGLTGATRSVTEAIRGARADATGTPPAAEAGLSPVSGSPAVAATAPEGKWVEIDTGPPPADPPADPGDSVSVNGSNHADPVAGEVP